MTVTVTLRGSTSNPGLTTPQLDTNFSTLANAVNALQTAPAAALTTSQVQALTNLDLVNSGIIKAGASNTYSAATSQDIRNLLPATPGDSLTTAQVATLISIDNISSGLIKATGAHTFAPVTYADIVALTSASSSSPVIAILPVITSNGNSPYTTGQQLYVSNGNWTNIPKSYAYQWQRAGVNISGATNKSYTIVSADVTAASITCIVTATNSYGSTSATSASVALSATPTYIYTFAGDTLAATPANITTAYGSNLTVVNTGAANMVGQYINTSGSSTGTNTYMLNFPVAPITIAPAGTLTNQTLTMQVSKSAAVNFGTVLRNQNVANTATDYTGAGINNGYYFQVGPAGLSIVALKVSSVATVLATNTNVCPWVNWFRFSVITSVDGTTNTLKIEGSEDGITFTSLLSTTDNTYLTTTAVPQLITGIGTTTGSQAYFANISLKIGQTYYMAVTGGSDSNSGLTPALGWASNGNIYTLKAGDTLTFLSGTYTLPATAFVWYNVSGTVDAPINIVGQGQGITNINGASVTVLQAIGITGNNASQIASNWNIRNLSVINTVGHGIRIDFANNVNVDHVTFSGNTLNGLCCITGNADASHVQNCTFSNLTAYNNCLSNLNGANVLIGWPEALSIDGTNNTLINCTAYNNWGEGLALAYGLNCKVLNCVSHDNYSQNVYIDHSQNCIINGNLIYNSYTSLFQTWISNTTIAGDTRFGVNSIGIDIADESASSSVFRNTGNTISNNVIINCYTGIQYDGTTSSGYGLKNSTIVNNTIVDSLGAGILISYPAAATNTVIENNIVVANKPGSPLTSGSVTYSSSYTAIGAQSGLTWNHNCWFANPNSNAVAASTAMSGAGDVVSDPLFSGVNLLNILAANYTLNVSSPCTGAGVSGLTSIDYSNNARTLPTSIGAYN